MKSREKYYNTSTWTNYKVTKLSKGIEYVKTDTRRLYTWFDVVSDALVRARSLFAMFWFVCMVSSMVLDEARTEGKFSKLLEGIGFDDFLVGRVAIAVAVTIVFNMMFSILEMLNMAFSTEYKFIGRIPVYDASIGVGYILASILGSMTTLIVGITLFSIFIPMGYILAFCLTFILDFTFLELVNRVLLHLRGCYIRKHLTEEKLEEFLVKPMGTAEMNVSAFENEVEHEAQGARR